MNNNNLLFIGHRTADLSTDQRTGLGGLGGLGDDLFSFFNVRELTPVSPLFVREGIFIVADR